MRLGTLAKKIGVKPSALADYLNKHHPAEEAYTLNSKLEEALISHSISYFTEDFDENHSKNIDSEINKDEDITGSSTTLDENLIVKEESNSEYTPKFQRGDEISADIIESAPYIEKQKIVLDGPKIVDKIDPDALAQRLDKKKLKDDEERQKRLKEKAQKEKEKAEAKYERYVKAKKRAEEREKREEKKKQERQKKKLAQERQKHYLEKIQQKKLQTSKTKEVVIEDSKPETHVISETTSIKSKKPLPPLKRIWDWLINA